MCNILDLEFFHIMLRQERYSGNSVIRKMSLIIAPLTFLEIFLILKQIQRDIIIKGHKSSCKLPIITVRFLIKFEFSRHDSKIPSNSFHAKPSRGS
jgi:hypothetical protein